jgi:protein-disulfide isomerase
MAAHNQGKFWEMHDKIFADQRTLTDEQYLLYAQELGLDVDQFKTDVAAPATQQALDADLKTAASVGVSGTPAFFVNGRYLSGAQPFESFKGIIDEELNKPS